MLLCLPPCLGNGVAMTPVGVTVGLAVTPVGVAVTPGVAMTRVEVAVTPVGVAIVPKARTPVGVACSFEPMGLAMTPVGVAIVPLGLPSPRFTNACVCWSFTENQNNCQVLTTILITHSPINH
jgi:hypothetical protein